MTYPSELVALGLSPVDAEVLAVVIAREEVSPSDIAAAVGLHRAAASRAIGHLESLGLISRVARRRPTQLFLSATADLAVQRMVDQATRNGAEQELQVERAAAALTAAHARRRDRERPYFELEPGTRSCDGSTGWPAVWGRTSHDEVLPASDLGVGRPAISPMVRGAVRVLVTGIGAPNRDREGGGEDKNKRFDLLSRQLPVGAELRSTHEDFPRLTIVDGERVAIRGSTQGGCVRAWSRDRAHVRAAQQLFGLWWDAATLEVRVPTRPSAHEPHWEVDEWDPDELHDRLAAEGS